MTVAEGDNTVSDEKPDTGTETDAGEKQEETPEQLVIPRMTDDELRTFVDDFVSNRVFTNCHIPNGQEDMLTSVFMPIALGAFAGQTDETMEQIGAIYEYYDAAGPRSINGFPCFFSMRMVHVDDWRRAREAIAKEVERRKATDV